MTTFPFNTCSFIYLLYHQSIYIQWHILFFGRIGHESIIFSDQFLKQSGRITLAVLDGHWHVEMIGAAGQDAAAPVLADQKKLRHHLFACMFGREALPPREAANAQQLRPVIEHIGSSHPCDFVAHDLAISDQPLFQVQRVGGIIDQVTLPRNTLGRKWLCCYRTGPQLYLLLVVAYRANSAGPWQDSRRSRTLLTPAFSPCVPSPAGPAAHHRRGSERGGPGSVRVGSDAAPPCHVAADDDAAQPHAHASAKPEPAFEFPHYSDTRSHAASGPR